MKNGQQYSRKSGRSWTLCGLLLLGVLTRSMAWGATGYLLSPSYHQQQVPHFGLLLNSSNSVSLDTLTAASTTDITLLNHLFLRLNTPEHRWSSQPRDSMETQHLLTSITADLLVARDLKNWLPLGQIGLRLGSNDIRPLPSQEVPSVVVGHDGFGVKLSPLALLFSLDQRYQAAYTLQFSISW